MKLNKFTTLCALVASAHAVSWVDTPENSVVAKFMLNNGGGDISEAVYNPTTATSLHRRDEMKDGKWYSGKAQYLGWVVQIGRCMAYEYASKWFLPSPSNNQEIDYVATQFADALAKVTGEGTKSMDIGGGWAMTAVGSSAYLPKNVPWSLAYDMMWDASTAASSWISWDNGVYWTVKDSVGDVIYTFLVLPLDAVGKDPRKVHDEN
ncbi:hypothetical protein NQ176_g3800 [Zarea fungicola]|uniref:Uncharacterized protein n=1 Tax=Zarea fungicola TaxID=93591 RepID=A0ACC1NIN4_9HYPO|nr:hypothetical protein NQ176_g3800 [Lecanicillium fungicola]